jgi:hypothetical protein
VGEGGRELPHPFVVSSLGYLAARRRRNVERLVGLLDERR